MTALRFAVGSLCAVACGLVSASASAQFDLGAYTRVAQRSMLSASGSMPRVFAGGRGGGVSLVVRSKTGAVAAPELTSLGDFAVGELTPERVLELSAAHPEWSFDWAPPRHTLLDRVDGWVHAASVRKETQTSGQGVVVGIVDTGVDLRHGDLQTADHKTRVAWVFDISRPAAKLHADLEAEYGCTVDSTACAIYAASDLDSLIASNGDLPGDPYGHGTHVASLAAGNGLSSPVPRYIGIAPEATYVVARVADANGAIQDTDVLRAVKFVFDRAEELGMPAVVNLSLGSDFGAHDGSSGLEMGLTSMVGPELPGRAIVVAAGNSAGLYDGVVSAYPGPFGIHTEVHVPDGSVARVPLLTPAPDGTTVHGSAFVWLEFRDGDQLSVGLDDKSGTRVTPVPVGGIYDPPSSDTTVTAIAIVNGVASDSSSSATESGAPGRHGAVLSIDGVWSQDSDFAIRLEGHGTAELWVQGVGDLDSASNLGALFPRGEREGTINVPASASGLIAVGATLNRTTWIDSVGTAIDMPNLGATDNAPLDTIAFFSAGGPNALGAIKPDIVAPGVWIAGAMASSVDPRRTGTGLFAAEGRCPTDEECFVVDDTHAITAGTSMSAPVVSGAIALLFQRDPTLTQDAVRAILQAGARPLQGIVLDDRQIGPGALDLEGALSVATAGESPALRIPTSQSWLTVSESYAHPDPSWPVTCYLDLRDEQGNIADGFDASRLRLSATPALVKEPLTRVAPGFYSFAVAAPANTGEQTLQLAVYFDDQLIAAKDLKIAVDRWVAEDGVSARGGCELAAPHQRSPGTAFAAGLLAALALARRRGHMRAK
ncbi:MAG TPA: S8 family serine peptidase [Polyangiaceae bacterium]|jgi:subtilisin family serine protease|nr:S8 family serine peptidase [Polyangiaceae bacterium]